MVTIQNPLSNLKWIKNTVDYWNKNSKNSLWESTWSYLEMLTVVRELKQRKILHKEIEIQNQQLRYIPI